MIVFSALMIWKGLMFVTKSESPVVRDEDWYVWRTITPYCWCYIPYLDSLDLLQSHPTTTLASHVRSLHYKAWSSSIMPYDYISIVQHHHTNNNPSTFQPLNQHRLWCWVDRWSLRSRGEIYCFLTTRTTRSEWARSWSLRSRTGNYNLKFLYTVSILCNGVLH